MHYQTKGIGREGRKIKKKTYYQQREDEIKIMISEAKVKNNLTNESLAKKIGMPLSTFSKLKMTPGKMRLDSIWLIEELAGRRVT